MSSQTIRVNKETKDKLDLIKIHPRETYNDVITRLVENKE
jgi:predicted CopG family antitoxin